MMKVIYFYYFLFYSEILNEDEPHFTAYFSLSASQGFLVNGIIDFIALKFYCYNIDKWPMIIIGLIIFGMNYFYYGKMNKGKEIVAMKPTFFNNRPFSIISSILFFLISLSWLFWGPLVGKTLLENCQ